MGRIKSTLVKRASRELMGQELQFTSKFEDNKKILNSAMPSKKIRNKIAGYIARLKNAENKENVSCARLGRGKKEKGPY